MNHHNYFYVIIIFLNGSKIILFLLKKLLQTVIKNAFKRFLNTSCLKSIILKTRWRFVLDCRRYFKLLILKYIPGLSQKYPTHFDFSEFDLFFVILQSSPRLIEQDVLIDVFTKVARSYIGTVWRLVELCNTVSIKTAAQGLMRALEHYRDEEASHRFPKVAVVFS